MTLRDRFHRSFTTATVVAVLAGSACVAAADMLQLKDGRSVDGPKMERVDDAIVVHFENGDVRVPLELVEDFLIEGFEIEPRTEEERAKRAEGLVPFEGEWVKPEVRAREIAKAQKRKREALEEYKAHSKWGNHYVFETKNFKFESTLEPWKNEYCSDLLETYFKEFGKLWKVRAPKDWGKLAVFMHRDLDSFHRRGGVSGGVQAYYRFVEPRELHFYWDRRDPEGSVGAMFHECNHYLADLIEEDFKYPHWIGEGMAEYFSGSKWDPDKKQMSVGEIQEGRLVEVVADMDRGKNYELSRLIGAGLSDYEHYYWGWSFVHFMMKSPKYAKNFQKYIVDLARDKGVDRERDGRNHVRVSGESCMAAFKKRMKVDDIAALEKEWYEYIKTLDNSGLRGIERAGFQAFSQGRVKFRASRLLKEAIDKGTQNAQVYIRYAQCLLMKGEGQDAALVFYVRACEVDPLDGWTWASRGYQLKQMNRVDEGEKFIALAKEVDPDEDFLELEVASKLGESFSEDD